MGPAVLAAWNEDPGFAVVLLLSFYTTMISVSMVLIILMGTTLLLGSKVRRSLIFVSAFILAGLGFYFMSLAGWRLVGKYLSEAANQLSISNPLRF